MSTFSNSSFDAAGYAASRPTYPPILLDMVLHHHLHGKSDGDGKNRALDLGCGPGEYQGDLFYSGAKNAIEVQGDQWIYGLIGQVTQLLPNHFASVLGSDPSAVMIEQAKKQNIASNVAFVVSPAEDIVAKIDSASIDLVVAGEAAHWFDHKQLWPALARILKPGGTVAYWCYAESRISGHPELTPLIDEYCNGDRGLGPHWQEPGNKICENLYRDISFPASEEWDLASGKRVYFTGDTHFPDLKLPRHPLPASNAEKPFSVDEDFRTDMILAKTMTWAQIEGWWRTASALHAYLEQHPDERARTGQGKEGDILDRFVYSLRERLGTDDVTVEWPLGLMMIKKRSA